ncbi:MAG: hypothetical protein C0506_03910 [Anaerolinea sp.]|nr:hypothetical protein [Anaerolinea sp.]
MKALVQSKEIVLMFAMAAVVLLAVLSAGCLGEDTAEASIPGGKRTFYVTAMEYKGSTEVSKEAFPADKLPEGGGYGLKAPAGEPPKWEVNAYAWAPASLTVAEGDDVTLKFVGINGAQHVSRIEGHVEKFTVERGKVATVQFTAGKPGVYLMICNTHQPNMVGQLVVLPKE